MLAASVLDSTQIVGAIVVLLTLVVSVGSAIVVQSRTRGLSDSVTALETANRGLRDANTDLQLAVAEEAKNCDRKMHEQEVRYTSEISTLRGKMDMLTSDLAERLVAAAVKAAKELRDD